MVPIDTNWRGNNQCDIHVGPAWVEAGEENVLVSSADLVFSEPRCVWKVGSFLGVMPGDVVEMAVDVLNLDTQEVVYARSLHKECNGIYDAWDMQESWSTDASRLRVTFTCRVNDKNRDGEMKSFFEGLAKLILS